MIFVKEMCIVIISLVWYYSLGNFIRFNLFICVKNFIIFFEKNKGFLGVLVYSDEGEFYLFLKFIFIFEVESIIDKVVVEFIEWVRCVEVQGGEDLGVVLFVFGVIDQFYEWK